MPSRLSGEHPTLIPCPACGGEFRRVVEKSAGKYATEVCAHCSEGAMDDAQLQAWRAHRVSLAPNS